MYLLKETYLYTNSTERQYICLLRWMCIHELCHFTIFLNLRGCIVLSDLYTHTLSLTYSHVSIYKQLTNPHALSANAHTQEQVGFPDKIK